MKLPYTICYISAGNNIEEQDIKEIFSNTEAHNNRCEIRGILLYSKETNRFFQVLEGGKEEVKNLYHEKILKDPRHKDIAEVFHKPTSKPVFFKYSSTFNLIKSGEELDAIKKYMQEHKYSRDGSDKVLRLLEPFFIFYS
ncbi:MAG: BLUF domain-containing protein [Gramella sp.]|nr:BLUF domain-containing protein [Christiangramia sp.]